MRGKPEEKKRLPPAKALAALGARFASISGTAKNVLEEVIAIPTRFIQLDHATRVGGFPIKRCSIIHGPSNEGKTALCLGLLGSFVDAGGMADLVDAEMTTPFSWVQQLLGPTADSERFRARKPSSYEECIDTTRDLHRAFKAAKDEGELPPHAGLLTVIDSLIKLTPEDFTKKILKHGASGEKGSVDGMSGRGAMIKAAMNASWLHELVPLCDACDSAWLAIIRETVDTEADARDRQFGNDYRLTGGKGVILDAALRFRVERAKFLTIGEDKKVVGEKHRVTILKTKVGGKEDRATVAYFHTSNGVIAPEGFDRPRDVVELGLRLGVLERAGSTIRWPSRSDKMFARSEENAIAALRFAEDDLGLLETEVRSKFSTHAPEEAIGEEAPHVEAPACV